MANVADGATGTILTAPSPATSGTTCTLNAGEGYRFPAVPFFAVAHQNNTIATVSTSEKLQVTLNTATTIASGSNGASLPQATINVVTTGAGTTTMAFPSSGSITVVTSAGAQVVAYTGVTGTTFTGCSGGTGTMSTGGAVVGDSFTFVRAISPYSAQSIATTWRFSNAIFATDLNNASLITNEVPVGNIDGSNTTYTTASRYQTGSLRVYKNGIRLKGSGNDYTETAGGFTMTTAPATGTLLLVDYFIGGTINNIGTNSIVTDEAPTGTINGSTTVFTTIRPYIAGSLEVYVNGLHQIRGTDITETTPASGTFTFATAPLTSDVVRCNYQYNLNPASNADTVDGIHANDYGDQSGAQLVSDTGGWKKFSQTLTYASSTTFTIPGDYTTILPKGSRLWLTQTTSKYFYVIKTVFATGTTTVTVTGGIDYTLANAAITSPYFSYAQNPQGFPGWFNYTPTNTGYSSTTRNLCRFRLDQTMCTAWYSSGGTSNSSALQQSLPIRCASNSNYNYEGTTGLAINSGSVMATPARVYQDPITDPTIVYVVPTAGTGSWTASGTKDARFTMMYEIE